MVELGALVSHHTDVVSHDTIDSTSHLSGAGDRQREKIPHGGEAEVEKKGPFV